MFSVCTSGMHRVSLRFTHTTHPKLRETLIADTAFRFIALTDTPVACHYYYYTQNTKICQYFLSLMLPFFAEKNLINGEVQEELNRSAKCTRNRKRR